RSGGRNRGGAVAPPPGGATKGADVAGGAPALRVNEDPGIEPDDVAPLLAHPPPPGALDIVLQLDAERAVIPDGVDPAVDLARRVDEAAPLGQRDDGLEIGDGRADVVGLGGRSGHRGSLR